MNLRKISRTFLYLLVVSASVFLLVEIALRVLGYKPYVARHYVMQSDPPDCFVKDSAFMISLRPGAFSVTVNEGLQYKATHNAAGHRVTCFDDREAALPEIVVMGCSFSYGLGVNDSLTYAFRLNTLLDSFTVENLSIPGTGLVHQIYMLKRHLAQGDTPAIANFNYLDFHEEREVLASTKRDGMRDALFYNKKTVGEKDAGAPWGYVYARLEKNQLEIKYKDLREGFSAWPGRTYSALVNLLEQTYNKRADQSLDAPNVAREALLLAQKVCKDNGIRMIVTRMSQHSEGIKEFCDLHHIENLDVSFDVGDHEATLHPHTAHPNARTHNAIAQALAEYISNTPAQ